MTTATITTTEPTVYIQRTEVQSESLDRKFCKYKFLIWEFETKLKWTNIVLITIWHIVAVCALIAYPFWEHWNLLLYGITLGGIGGFGITGGAHRYWTHKSFKAKLPLKLILLFCFSVAGQNSIKEWVRDHRVHHKYSETDADPHNVKRGFFFAHVGWLMMNKHPEVLAKGKSIDLSDLFEDPLIVFYEKYFIWFKTLCCFILPTLVCRYLLEEDWTKSILVVCFIRYVISLNCTWAVNSAAHLWGNKPYDKRIKPTENLTVSFFSMGEGYHNYHHTFPWDYRTAELGRSLNITTLWLNIFKYIGWAYDLKSPSFELVKKVIENHGDGSHLKWGHEVPEREDSRLFEMKKLIKDVKTN